MRCAFSYAMRTAWALANDVTVDLDIENADLAPLISILAAACDRSIKVQVNTMTPSLKRPTPMTQQTMH